MPTLTDSQQQILHFCGVAVIFSVISCVLPVHSFASPIVILTPTAVVCGKPKERMTNAS